MNCVSNSAMKYLRGQKQSKWSVNVLDDSAAGFEDPSFLRPGRESASDVTRRIDSNMTRTGFSHL